MMKTLGVLCAVLCLAACSSQTGKPAEAEKPQPKTPEVVTGRTAFQRMYIQARGWARDAQPFRLESQSTADCKGRDGKADVWHYGFASPTQRAVKPYVWSGTDASDAPSRGVTPGPEDSYSSSNANTQVFDIQFLKVDSDKALEVAQKHGGDKILAKDAELPVVYALDWNGRENQLVWHVIFGTSRDSAKLKVAVNASTGEFLRVEK
jgi:hypothetical protein